MDRLPQLRAPGRWMRGTDTSLSLLIALATAMSVVELLTRLPAIRTVGTSLGLVGLAALVASSVAVVVAALVPLRSAAIGFACGLTEIAGATALVVDSPHGGRPLIGVAPSLLPAALFAVLLMTPRARTALFVLLGAAAVTLEAVCLLAVCGSWRDIGADLAGGVPPLLTVIWLFSGLRELAAERDVARRLSVVAEEARDRAEQESRRRREVARLVHDSVLQALTAVASEAPRASVAELREACSRAHEVTKTLQPAGAAQPAGLLGCLQELPEASRLQVRWHGRDIEVPAEVSAVLVRSVREALRNVLRHSGTTACDVWLRGESGHSAEVVVADRGRGFDPAKLPRGRLGLAHSVIERTLDAGGRVSVHAQPGRGTTVTVGWPASAFHPELSLLESMGAAGRQLLAGAALPLLFQALFMAFLMGESVQRPLPAVMATFAAVAGGLGAMRVAARRSFHWWEALLLIAGGLAGMWINAWCVPTDTRDSRLLWMAGCCAALLIVVLATRPARQAPVYALAVLTGVTGLLAVRFGPPALADLYPAPLACLHVAVAGLAGLIVATRLTNRAAAEEVRARLAEDQRELAQNQDVAEQLWTVGSPTAAGPLLAEIADGQADPASWETRRRARLCEAALRDYLTLGPGQDALRGALHAARSRGWKVNAHLSASSTETQAMGVIALLRALGDPDVAEQACVASLRDEVTARLVIQNPGPRAELTARAWLAGGHDALIDEDFVELRLTLAAAVAQG